MECETVHHDDHRAAPPPKTSPMRSLSRFVTRARKRVHNADELMSTIVAKRLVEHLERSVFIVMKRSATANRLTRPNP